MKMIFPFPEATARQFIYGTKTMPPKYFDNIWDSFLFLLVVPKLSAVCLLCFLSIPFRIPLLLVLHVSQVWHMCLRKYSP
jgi:hypothetical protein